MASAVVEAVWGDEPMPDSRERSRTSNAPHRKPLSDDEVLYVVDEFLYHGEIRDFVKAQHSFERISSSLGTEDFDALIPPCMEVLEFSNQFIRNDTLLCLMYISLGCTLCDIPAESLAATMRKHAAVLAKHDAMPMFVRSLDFLLGNASERVPVEDGMLEREFRLIFNCIYLQLLFNEGDPGFIQTLELGQGRLGSSLVSLLFEAIKMCADNNKMPIKKVILLLLRVLQCLLDVPDHVLCPMPNPEQVPIGSGIPSMDMAAEPGKQPQLREFQAFIALHLHERSMQQKYSNCGFPAAVVEGLQIIHRYKQEFMTTYAFHPSEVSFMQQASFLREVYDQYEQLQKRGLTEPERMVTSRPPVLPHPDDAHQWVRTGAIGALGALAGVGDAHEQHALRHERRPGDPLETLDDGTASDSGQSTVSASSAVSSESDAEHAGGSASTAASGGGGSDSDSDATVVGHPPTRGRGARGDGVDIPDLPGGAGATAKARDVVAPDVKDRSPKAVFQRLYPVICPRLGENVVLFLRLLLTSCYNVENYPGVIDMARERHATAIADDAGNERELMVPFEKVMPSEAVEANRHREIMAAAVSGIILILLKQARKSVSEQFSSLAQLITDSNGALVVLKFLNQDLSSAMEPRDPSPVMACLQLARRNTSPSTAWVPSWPACASLRLVEVLYLLCKDSPDRVRKYLIHYKAPFILKRLMRIENQHVQGLVLKLLKKQVRYLPRKWKQSNMKAISAIYSLVPMLPLEDWLLNEPLGEPATEGPSQADIRTSNSVYNEALLRQFGAGSAARAQPLSVEGPATPNRTLRPDPSQPSSQSANAMAVAAAAAAAAGGSASRLAASGRYTMSGDADPGGSGGAGGDAWDGSSANHPPLPAAATPRMVGLALATAPGLSLSKGADHSLLGSAGHTGTDAESAAQAAAQAGMDALLAGMDSWQGPLHALPPAAMDELLEDLSNEALCYSEVFQQYAPEGSFF